MRLRAVWATVFSAVGAGLMAGCEPPRAADSVVVSDSAGLRVTTITVPPTDLEEWTLAPTPELVITGAESGDSAALAPVGSVRWDGSGDIIIADLGASRLLVYDAAGTFVQPLGRRGDGPGEFRSISAVSLMPGDTVVTFDGSLRRLSYWHRRNGFARSVSLAAGASLDAWPADAWPWRDSMIVVLQLAITPKDSVPAGAGMRRWPMRAHLSLRDREGAVVATSPTFPGMYTGLSEEGDTRLPFSNQPFVAIGRDRVFFGAGEDYRISSLAPEFRTEGEFRWPAADETLSAAEVAAVRAETEAVLRARLPPERLRRLDQNFAPEILPKTRPAIGRVLVDQEDRLWVERFEATRLGTRTQKPGDRWTVLLPNGRPVARVRLPSNTRLEAVQGQRVLVVQRDSLDTETVARYDIRRP
ncbi:MAG: hypothetical protein JNJ80_18680 [Gemmatimonadetes bacterium]|nr:hypothetical protein [Gemmatimonadota bacterium]